VVRNPIPIPPCAVATIGSHVPERRMRGRGTRREGAARGTEGEEEVGAGRREHGKGEKEVGGGLQ
jgi:hypothetical protein